MAIDRLVEPSPQDRIPQQLDIEIPNRKAGLPSRIHKTTLVGAGKFRVVYVARGAKYGFKVERRELNRLLGNGACLYSDEIRQRALEEFRTEDVNIFEFTGAKTKLLRHIEEFEGSNPCRIGRYFHLPSQVVASTNLGTVALTSIVRNGRKLAASLSLDLQLPEDLPSELEAGFAELRTFLDVLGYTGSIRPDNVRVQQRLEPPYMIPVVVDAKQILRHLNGFC